MNETAPERSGPRNYPRGHGAARLLPDSGPVRQVMRVPGSAMEERRFDRRLQAVEHKAWLCWWCGTEVVKDAVILVNISWGGAALIVADPPLVDEAVWFHLEPGPAPEATAIARVSGVEPLAEKMWRVRLRFEARCPTALLEAASSGHAAFVSGLD